MNVKANAIAVIAQLVVPEGDRAQFDQGYARIGELVAQSPGFLSSELGQSTDLTAGPHFDPPLGRRGRLPQVFEQI